MAGLGTTEILIILAVVLLLFGSSKLPTLARSLGKSARILKAETKGLHDDDDDDGRTAARPAPAPQAAGRASRATGSAPAASWSPGSRSRACRSRNPGRVRDSG